jgi:hypothetical protein
MATYYYRRFSAVDPNKKAPAEPWRGNNRQLSSGLPEKGPYVFTCQNRLSMARHTTDGIINGIHPAPGRLQLMALLRKLFYPILVWFEGGDQPYAYRPLNRKVLLAMGTVFSALAVAVVWFKPTEAEGGYWAPVLIFGLVGLVALVIGFLGSDRAVARIWGNK